jgi:DNA-binding HxlR family transcriptional regulator
MARSVSAKPVAKSTGKSIGKTHDSTCPVAFALDLFGDRWTLLVVRDLMLRGDKTYGELLDGGEGIATNILADRLRTLEAAGIVTARPDPANGRRKIYSLTAKGLDLAPVVIEIVRWSGLHDDRPDARKALARRIARDAEGVLDDIRARRPVSRWPAD